MMFRGSFVWGTPFPGFHTNLQGTPWQPEFGPNPIPRVLFLWRGEANAFVFVCVCVSVLFLAPPYTQTKTRISVVHEKDIHVPLCEDLVT